MSSRIENLKYELLSLTSGAKKEAGLKKKIEKLFSEVTPAVSHKFEAILPTRSVDFGRVEIHWSSLMAGEDYEGAYYYNVKHPVDGWLEVVGDDERDELLEKTEEQIEAAEAALDKFIADFEGKLPSGESRPESEAEEKLRDEIQELEDFKSDLENADQEYVELMWNYSWQPEGRAVDTALVDSIPNLTWVRKTSTQARYDGDGDAVPGCDEAEGTYLTLSGIGQDNGPAIMAYIALAFHTVDSEHVHYWTSQGQREWVQHVIGRDCFLRCADALGVRPQLEKALAEDEDAKRLSRIKAEKLEKKRAKDKRKRISQETKDHLRQGAANKDIGWIRELANERYKSLLNQDGFPENLKTDVVLKELHRMMDCGINYIDEAMTHYKVKP